MVKKYLFGVILGVVFMLAGCTNSSRSGYQGEFRNDRISYFSRYGYPRVPGVNTNKSPYLKDTNHLQRNRNIGKGEGDFLRFYKDLNVKGYGDNSDYCKKVAKNETATKDIVGL